MVKAYRTLAFYKVYNYRVTNNSKGSEQQYLDIKENKAVLRRILENTLTQTVEYKNGDNILRRDVKIIPFNAKFHSCTLDILQGYDEFLKNNRGYIFGRLSRPKDANAYQRRNKKTKITNPITLQGEIFESKSYFILDTDTMSFCYLNEEGAPSALVMKDFFENVTKDIVNFDRVFSNVCVIQKKDGLEVLSKKDYVGSIYYNMAFSDKSKLEETGLNQKQFEFLSHQKYAAMTMKLVVERGKQSFEKDKRSDLRKFIRSLIHKGATNIKVMAKDDEEHMQAFAIENNPLALKVGFDYFNNPNMNLLEFEERLRLDLVTKYESQKVELSAYLADMKDNGVS